MGRRNRDKEARLAEKAERKENRKPFNETGLGMFLKDKAPMIIKGVGNAVLDRVGLGDLMDTISNSTELTTEDKEHALKLLEFQMMEMEEITKRWLADSNSDSWLARNVRPMTLAYMLIVMSVVVIWDSVSESFSVKPAYITMIETILITVIIAYFGSRGIEKYRKISD